jgi:peptide chain release factor 3
MLNNLIGDRAADQLRENIELVDGIYPSFDKDSYLKGELQPVFLVLH